MTSCTPAFPGYFVGTTGAASPVNCSPGSFTSTPGQSACTPASPGFFVPLPGATAQQACPPGTASPAGAASCTVLPTSADLSLTEASAAPNPAGSGKDVIYTFTVSNAGPASATGVTFTDPVPVGASYVVTSDDDAISHVVTAGNLTDMGTATVLDDVRLNSAPNMILIATHNLTPGGVPSGDFLVESPIGIAYDGATGRWKIFVENGLPGRISVGDAFNVVILPPSSTAFRHVVVPGGIVGGVGTSTSVPGGSAMHAIHVATQVGGGPYLLNNDVLVVYVSGFVLHKLISNVTGVPMVETNEFFVWVP